LAANYGNIDDVTAFEKVDQLGLILVPVDGGEPITDFLLHIDGNTAWFRC